MKPWSKNPNQKLSSSQILPLTDEDWMPFGKYGPKGTDPRRLKDVPSAYLDWLAGQAFLYQWPRLEQYIERSRKAIDQDLKRKGVH